MDPSDRMDRWVRMDPSDRMDRWDRMDPSDRMDPLDRMGRLDRENPVARGWSGRTHQTAAYGHTPSPQSAGNPLQAVTHPENRK
jgi:hypothetical protein